MRRTVVRLSLTAAAALACSGAAAQAAAVRSDAGPGQRAPVQQAAHVPAGATVTGTVAAGARVQLTLALTPSDPQALADYAQQVSDPGSALYRHYLSVGGFASRFGADPSEVASVRTALSQAGLSVGSLSANGLALSASGSAGQIEAAFATQLDDVSLAGGSQAYADVTDPTLPAAAADAVQGVTGLSTLPAASPQGLVRAGRALRPRSDGADAPETTGIGGPGSCTTETRFQLREGGYTAPELGSAYGFDGEWTAGDVGTGATVALVELEPYTRSDVNAYQTCDGTTATVSNTQVDGGASCNGDSNCGLEDVLDIEDIAGLVPDSSIDVYEGPNTDQGLYDVYENILDSDAPVISTSWGACEADDQSSMLTEENTIFEEAAAQGEAVFAAAGDDGADDCKTTNSDPEVRAVDDPASQPYVTGVGGTTLTSAADPAGETVWNDSSSGDGAGGGGVSREWATPAWQSADAVAQSSDAVNGATLRCDLTPGSSTTTTSCREVPDVTADADPDTGYDIYWDGAWQLVGGTSAAAPTWASLVALADSSYSCTAGSVQVGFANPLLYGLPSSDFYDVTSGDNSYSGVSGYSALSGYDMASGLGAPNAIALVPALCAGSTTPPPNTQTTTTQTTPTTTTVVQTATAPAPVTTPTTTTTTTFGTPGPGAVGRVRFVAHRGRHIARLGRRVRVVLHARDEAGLLVRYTARRLPRGLHINRRTGVISGRPKRTGRSVSSITARDSHGDSQTVVIRWVVRRG
ncbi:MAG TPA: protease pro-enzyme activation domain-containing protein [Solirubrobacteraceae bacterium]|nr:protease pro-enzyme activation domain-containing protein [Solirubrobacteraceae bacterium]